ncbi:MAG: 30S ribosomal protein S30e [Candidatus Bathyarchaeota archaeon]|nr:30S ribosomal protein S30e [Candidatus Bathyarchaeota archaeon]
MPTHGSLTKAGKVRSLSGSKKDRSKPRLNPRVKNKRKYNNRIILQRNAHRGETQGGQYEPSQPTYPRRRRR